MHTRKPGPGLSLRSLRFRRFAVAGARLHTPDVLIQKQTPNPGVLETRLL